MPDNYKVRKKTAPCFDETGPLKLQPHVYSFSDYIASTAGLEWIIDIGCGSDEQLAPRTRTPNAKFVVHDLRKGSPRFSKRVVRNALIICSNVLEHIANPKGLMQDLAKLSKKAPFVVISTPDRSRARSWLDNGPPLNPAHAMEWTGTEFIRFMLDCGFDGIPFYGHTINTDLHRVKSTILTLTGTHANPVKIRRLKRIAAIIHGYNEADILPKVFQHLTQQGIETHYFDNWSEDGSWEIALDSVRSGLVAHSERFPDKPTAQCQWYSQLVRTEEYAKNIEVDWILHHDADEIRLSPWRDVTLQEAISWIDSLGYNAIDFTVIDFRFLKSVPNVSPPFQQNLGHFEFGRRPGHFVQVKGWKNVKRVNLAESAGHNVLFEGRRVYPLKFLLKHYPLRNKEQSENKIFKNRLPRYVTEKERYGWHTQYDRFKNSMEITGWEYHDLVPWHPILFNTEYVVERLSGIGL